MPMLAQRGFVNFLVLAAATISFAAPAKALEEVKGEKDRLRICERRLCEMIIKKSPSTGEISCALTKTWARKSIKDNSESRKVSWNFGDARCTVDLKLPRSLLVAAFSQPEIKLELPLHKVRCEIEREKEITHLELTLGPKVSFSNGQAKKVWINLKHVEGPSAIKGLAMTVAKLEDGVGLFQKDLVKAINKFISQRCPAVIRAR